MRDENPAEEVLESGSTDSWEIGEVIQIVLKVSCLSGLQVMVFESVESNNWVCN